MSYTEMIAWMADKISVSLKGKERISFLEGLKEKPEKFLVNFQIDMMSLITSYCFLTAEAVIVNNIPEAKLDIVKRLQECLKDEIAKA
jgi:hypothetical protein